jgi:hypothetical protein
MAGQYNQAVTVPERIRPYKLASRLQLFTKLLHEEKTSPSEGKTPPSEENTSKDREESANTSKDRKKSATVGFARSNQ